MEDGATGIPWMCYPEKNANDDMFVVASWVITDAFGRKGAGGWDAERPKGVPTQSVGTKGT